MTMLAVLVRIRNDDGSEVWAKMDTKTARKLHRLEMREAKREQRHRAREKTFTDIGIDPGQVADYGNPWQGPRFRFTWLIGESRTWNGPPEVTIEGETYCTICWGAPLPETAYCLGCDATGRELQIPGPGVTMARPYMQQNGCLKGGLEGKR
jgi:hypothetical protein